MRSGMTNEPSAPDVARPISSATLTTLCPSGDSSAAYTMTTAPGTGTLAPPAAGVYWSFPFTPPSAPDWACAPLAPRRRVASTATSAPNLNSHRSRSPTMVRVL